MTPADILAAARLAPLSPVVPAREEWLEHWVGPVLVHRHHPDVPAGFWDDGAYIGGWADSGLVRTCDQERMRLDLRRREVRHRLVDCGAPGWCMESVAGMLAWVMLGSALARLPNWTEVDHPASPWTRRDDWMAPTFTESTRVGWTAVHNARFLGRGPEAGLDGRACADLAALRAGCVLEEADGWYIPLPGGAVGWLPRESA